MRTTRQSEGKLFNAWLRRSLRLPCWRLGLRHHVFRHCGRDQNPSGDTSTLQPANSKSIAKIEGGDGDQYALHLTASGDSSSSTVTTAVPADIVLVLDKSGSMKNSNRDTNAKNAATALASKLLTATNAALPAEQQVQMAVVTFSDRARTTSQFTTSPGAIGTAVSAWPNGGTNWEDA